jgi:hypothetical protein
LHREEPDFALKLTNFAVVLLPFAFSILFAFVPDMRTKHIAWRILVIVIGVGFSCLVWEQQQLSTQAARKDQQDAINIAVNEANKHSDSQIGAVRGDLT